MRIPAFAANILLPAAIAIAIVAIWFWATGSTALSIPAVIGLALAAAGVTVVVEWLIRQAQQAWRRRTRPARHRKPAV